MYTDVDPDEETAQQNLSKAYVLYQKTVVALNFVDLEVMKEKESIEKYLAEDACNAYRYQCKKSFVACLINWMKKRSDDGTNAGYFTCTRIHL